MSGPWKVGLAGLAIGVALAFRLLAPAGWDPSVVGAFGTGDPQTEYARQALGRDVVTRDAEVGHDGRFFFIQGNDPWVLEPDDHATWLDRPLYRAQRMVYPLIASVGGLAPPEAVLWGMIAVNVLAMGAGAFLTGALAVSYGGSAWWGLAFPLNLAMIDEFGIGGAGIVALAALMAGVLLLRRAGPWPAAVAFSIAVLAREASLIFVVGVFVFSVVHEKRRPWQLLGLPLALTAAWALYLRFRLPRLSGVDHVELIGWPLQGLIGAISGWRLLDAIAIGLWFVVAGVVLARGIRNPTALSWGAIGYLGLAAVLATPVWANFYDITRATAPFFTVWVLVSFAVPRRHQPAASNG